MKAAFPVVWRFCIATTAIITACASSLGMFLPPKPTPIDRLLKQAEAYIEKYPKDASGKYTLARIHYLAFHLRRDQIPAWDREGERPPGVAPQAILQPFGWDPHSGNAATIPNRKLADHALLALRSFNETLQIHPVASPYFQNLKALTFLGRASLEEEFLTWNSKVRLHDLPPELAEITIPKAREDYETALTIAMGPDSRLTHLPLEGLEDIISYEAANGLIRLAAQKDAPLTEKEQKDLERSKSAVEHFKILQVREVTPMVVSFVPVSHLDELLAPETIVDFDLRGYGPRERWPWVKPELGLLVWDPNHTGHIESARQLFGGYSFEIFRANGYDALAALDDNGDGVLSGSELDGICVWFNRNRDGVSTPDEVIPVRDLGIVAIAVKMDGYDGIHPTNAHGITLKDGSTLRTWDWIAEPLPRQRISQKERAF
jgi:hypothetical protein